MGGSGSGDNKEEGKEETLRQRNGKRLKHDGIVALLCLICATKLPILVVHQTHLTLHVDLLK